MQSGEKYIQSRAQNGCCGVNLAKCLEYPNSPRPRKTAATSNKNARQNRLWAVAFSYQNGTLQPPSPKTARFPTATNYDNPKLHEVAQWQ